MKIGLVEQVRRADQLSIQYGISGLQLMRNAATAVYEVILEEKTSRQSSVCILCGSGNNAGDGFALASMLTPHFANVSLMLLYGDKFSADAKYYFKQLDPSVKITDKFPEADIYVDAVFGTGFHGELPGDVRKIFDLVNQSDSLRIAIDVPSGVYSDSGAVAEGCFKADITVTFEILKRCHLLCRQQCGRIAVKKIGLSTKALDEIEFFMEILELGSLPEKNSMMHKGGAGTLFSVVGSKLYQGAATLSVNAALRSGCGIVMAFVPESIYVPLCCKTTSAIIASCSENATGQLSSKMLCSLEDHLKKRKPTAILAGSGMGLCDDTGMIIDHILKENINCVIDGDGLRYVRAEQLAARTAETVLTPHMGEFAALCGCSVEEVISQRFDMSRKYAQENRVTLVLKDYITVISLPDGNQFVLDAPNPGLAKGGSGDVLAGMIASFLAEGLTAAEAAKAGVWFHSAAGKYAAAKLGVYAMLPEDIISFLGKVF